MKVEAQNLSPRYSPATKYTIRGKLVKAIKSVVFSKEALLKTFLYVGLVDKEVGWLGSVVEKEDHYYVEDVFLFKQEVTGTTTDLSPEDIQKFIMDVIEEEGEEAGIALNNKLRFWGHSHVNMGITPSGTDDATMDEHFKDLPFGIRAIANKKGEMKVDVYNFELGLEAHDVAWREEGQDIADIYEAIKGEVDEKVTEKKYTPPGKNWKTTGNITELTELQKTDLGLERPWWMDNREKTRTEFLHSFLGIEEGVSPNAS